MFSDLRSIDLRRTVDALIYPIIKAIMLVIANVIIISVVILSVVVKIETRINPVN